MGWSKALPIVGLEREARPVDRKTIWVPTDILLKNRATIIRPEMNSAVGPMLYDMSGNTIIYDYFIRDGFFYMISTYWSNASPTLNITINNNSVLSEGYQEYMPTRYFKYPCSNTGIVWVNINGVEYELLPDIIKPLSVKHRFGIVLNFKYETAAWIRRFLDYYRSQGADAFYFYYNGSAASDLSDMPQGSDIIYKSWDCKFKIHTNRFIHSAQTTAYTSFRLRYYDDCEWVAAIDFDEFICDITEKYRIVDMLKKFDCGIVMINNHWATVDPAGGTIKYSLKSSGFAYDNGRTKCLYNTRKYRDFISIHCPKGDCLMIKSKRMVFFHIVDCLHPERSDLLVTPVKRTTTVKVARL